MESLLPPTYLPFTHTWNSEVILEWSLSSDVMSRRNIKSIDFSPTLSYHLSFPSQSHFWVLSWVPWLATSLASCAVPRIPFFMCPMLLVPVFLHRTPGALSLLFQPDLGQLSSFSTFISQGLSRCSMCTVGSASHGLYSSLLTPGQSPLIHAAPHHLPWTLWPSSTRLLCLECLQSLALFLSLSRLLKLPCLWSFPWPLSVLHTVRGLLCGPSISLTIWNCSVALHLPFEFLHCMCLYLLH